MYWILLKSARTGNDISNKNTNRNHFALINDLRVQKEFSFLLN